ncbi:hypothetical protein BV898_14431 [Hypsibius exemplaris]|uniref:Uncharacterized protein n=1 Tax=Hypsibius exemplaris TaxID=2072580 RepID=A0A9X6RJK2_HYPEX|nr:hypothetical protein BV898_14431 [Hypsibius exemplaris]
MSNYFIGVVVIALIWDTLSAQAQTGQFVITPMGAPMQETFPQAQQPQQQQQFPPSQPINQPPVQPLASPLAGDGAFNIPQQGVASSLPAIQFQAQPTQNSPPLFLQPGSIVQHLGNGQVLVQQAPQGMMMTNGFNGEQMFQPQSAFSQPAFSQPQFNQMFSNMFSQFVSQAIQSNSNSAPDGRFNGMLSTASPPAAETPRPIRFFDPSGGSPAPAEPPVVPSGIPDPDTGRTRGFFDPSAVGTGRGSAQVSAGNAFSPGRFSGFTADVKV